jgi:hypothetical protein
MNAADRSREFVYRGNAVAAAGYLRSFRGRPVPPDSNTVTVHGESSLPVIGGISESIVRPRLAFREFIDYGRCETFAGGTGDSKSKTTIVASSVDRVRVTASPTPDDEVPHLRSVSFRADRLSIAIRSIHPDDGEARFTLLGEPETAGISLLHTHVTGQQEVIPLRLEFDKDLLSRRTYSDLQKSDEFRKRAWPQSNGYIIASIVRRIYRGDQAIEGSVLRERGLGTIYFGEVLINDHNRRITLVRVEMGSDPEGSVMMAAADPNGIWR